MGQKQQMTVMIGVAEVAITGCEENDEDYKENDKNRWHNYHYFQVFLLPQQKMEYAS